VAGGRSVHKIPDGRKRSAAAVRFNVRDLKTSLVTHQARAKR